MQYNICLKAHDLLSFKKNVLQFSNYCVDTRKLFYLKLLHLIINLDVMFDPLRLNLFTNK